jgi:hypothetical protein
MKKKIFIKNSFLLASGLIGGIVVKALGFSDETVLLAGLLFLGFAYSALRPIAVN